MVVAQSPPGGWTRTNALRPIEMSSRTVLTGSFAAAAVAVAAAAGGWSYVRAQGEQAAVASAHAPGSFADVIQKVAPAVVSIDITGKVRQQSTRFFSGPNPFSENGDGEPNLPFGFGLQPFFGPNSGQPAPPRTMEATGSGFFISTDGYILTNNHVVEGADKITVRTNDDRELPARVVGRDPSTDLAVIKVDGGGFPYVDFENKAKPRVGDWVIAVGNPFNLGGSATAGIVSALARPRVSGNSYVDYLQIDAPINRGNSGGPTFDVYGRVVGVNTAIFSPSGGSVGIGFDIPADVAQSISRQLIAYGKVTRGYIGATIQDVTPDIAESLGLKSHEGALVADLAAGGPSEAAGLQSGDLITAIDGRPIRSSSDLTRQIALVHPGAQLRLSIVRNGQHRDVEVRAGVRPSEMTLASNNQDTAEQGGVLGMLLSPNPDGGVAIRGVAADSDARDKGLQSGDVILRVGGMPANAPADVSAAVRAAHEAHRNEVLLLVRHDGHRIFIPLDIPKATG
jgi:serine protease Do